MKDIELRYTGLIAACGMNCGLCIGYLREKKPCSGCSLIKDANMIYWQVLNRDFVLIVRNIHAPD
jgi:hypothetical protein